MIDPIVWAALPFKNPTAWTDFVGTFGLWHRCLSPVIFTRTGKTYRTYPLGDGGATEWLQAHQQEDAGACAALGIAGPPDMRSFDLSRADDFASWTFIVANEHRRIAAAAGMK